MSEYIEMTGGGVHEDAKNVKETRECAFGVNSKVCAEPSVVRKLEPLANSKGVDSAVHGVDGALTEQKERDSASDTTSAEKTMDTLKERFKCVNESCLFEKQEIKDIIGADEAARQLAIRFKPIGPWDSDDWFSNVDIDSVLKQIAGLYKSKNFKHIKFQMRDFDEVKSELAHINFVHEYNNNIRCFGVVFNTDYSTGKGKHWYAIFGDFSSEPFTIEYFNSSGEDPQPEIHSWMEKTKNLMKKELNKEVELVVVTKIVNQRDNHSCGSYSLYYIISRLEGKDWKFFRNNKIGDEVMHNLRKNHLFRKMT